MTIPSWIPLESNPEVFNGWASQAGLDLSDAQFCDLYALDSEYLSTIPRPVKAVILVFPYTEARYRREAEDERIEREGGPTKIDKSVFWMKQTIRNACGAMAIIHSLANTDAKLLPSSPLSTFYATARPIPPLERSKLFEETPIFTEIHASVATAGQCELPLTDEHVDQAYTCFVSVPVPGGEGGMGRRVVELDGGRAGPVDWGECLELLDDVGRIAREEFVGKSESVKFSVMYLGRPAI